MILNDFHNQTIFLRPLHHPICGSRNAFGVEEGRAYHLTQFVRFRRKMESETFKKWTKPEN